MKRGGQIPPRAPGSAGKASQYLYTVFIVAFLFWCIALIPGLGTARSESRHGGLFPVRAKPAGSAALARFAELYDAIGGGGGGAAAAEQESGVPIQRPIVPTSVDVSGAAVPAAKTPYDGAAIVTLAGGDTSAKHAIALIQSLRDVKTVLPIIVLLARGGLGSATCHNNTWRRINNRDHIECRGPDTIGA